jgi:hypothetical protein
LIIHTIAILWNIGKREEANEGVLRKGGSHCKAIFAVAIPNLGQQIASTGKERRFRNDSATCYHLNHIGVKK